MTDVKLICVDMDGTLLSPDHRTISAENLRAIAFAQSRGVPVVPATGRIVTRLKEQLVSLPETRYAIVANGGEVVELTDGRVLGGRYLTAKATLHLLRLLHGQGLAAMVYQADQMLITPQDLARMKAVSSQADHLDQLLALQVPVEDFAARFAANDSRIQKINVPYVDPPVLRSRLMEEFAALGIAQITTSMPHNIECNAPGVTKAVGLSVLCDRLGLAPGQTAAIGDGVNDLELFAAAGVAVAMGNAAPSVKQAADWVTASNGEDGVAQAIYRLLGGTHNG